MRPIRRFLLSYVGLLALFGITAERLTCIWHSAQVRSAADAAANAGSFELARNLDDHAVVSAIHRKADMDGFGPNSGARVSATISPDRKSVFVIVTKADLPCLIERLGLSRDKGTATSVVSIERQPGRSGASHSVCFNLFPC